MYDMGLCNSIKGVSCDKKSWQGKYKRSINKAI